MTTTGPAVADGPGHSRHANPAQRFSLLAIGVAAVLVAGVLAVALLVGYQTAIYAIVVLGVAAVLTMLPKTGAAYLIGFVTLLFLIPSTLTISGPLSTIGQPSTVLGWGAGVLWVAGRLGIDSGLDRRRNPARWLTLFFAMTLVVAYGVAYTRPLTTVEANGTFRSVLKLVSYIGVGLLAMDTIKDRKQLERLLLGIIFGTAFSAVVGLIRFKTGFNYVEKLQIPGLHVSKGSNTGKSSYRGSTRRVTGTAHHPIEFGVTLAVALPLALHYASYLKKGGLRQLVIVCGLVIAIAIPTAVSRTALVDLALVAVFVGVGWSWRRRANVLAAFVVVVLGVAVLSPHLLLSMRKLFYTLVGIKNSNSINGRTKDYQNLLPYLHGHWLLGRGQGTFQVSQYFVIDNQYLNTLVAGGLLELVGVLGLYFGIVFLGWGAKRRSVDAEDRSLGQALATCGIVLGFSAATFDLFGFTQAVGLTFLLLGITGAFWRIVFYEQRELRRTGLVTVVRPGRVDALVGVE